MKKEDKQLKLANQIKKYRVNLGLTQEEVAKHLKISRICYLNLEKGTRGLDSFELFKLADLFGIELIRFRDDPDDCKENGHPAVRELKKLLSDYEKLKQLTLEK